MERNEIVIPINSEINNKREIEHSELINTFKNQLDMWITYFDRIIISQTSLSDAIFIAFFITELNIKCLLIKEYNISNFRENLGTTQRRLDQIGHRFDQNFDLFEGRQSAAKVNRIKFELSKIKKHIRDTYGVDERYENLKYNHNCTNCIFSDNSLTSKMESLLKELVNYGRK